LSRVAACCSVLQRVATCCSVLQCIAVHCSVLQCVTVPCSVLQCITVRCSALERVAVPICYYVTRLFHMWRDSFMCSPNWHMKKPYMPKLCHAFAKFYDLLLSTCFFRLASFDLLLSYMTHINCVAYTHVFVHALNSSPPTFESPNPNIVPTVTTLIFSRFVLTYICMRIIPITHHIWVRLVGSLKL